MNKLDETRDLLLVDDEDGFRQTMIKRLGKRGFTPLQAANGEDCLDILRTTPVGVVVLDVRMPGISGIETLKAIKQLDDTTQVILLTGNVAVSDGIEGIKSGAFDYLTKPVEIDHLVNKINQAFELIRLEKEKIQDLEYSAKLEKKMIDTERLVSLGTMSTGIAHEINNPLAIINESAGYMKALIQSQDMPVIPQKEALLKGIDKIEKSIKRARKITHQLLGHVKRQASEVLKVDPGALVNETLGLLKKDLQEKNIQVVWKGDRKKKSLYTDPYQIRQVLMNLLTNAVHAMVKNGTLTLSIHETDGNVLLEIKDDGSGIAKEHIGKIFDPFFTTKSFEQGTGLGLFVVHKILSNLNGRIDVDSTLGRGTLFTVTLPKKWDEKKPVKNNH